MTDTDTSIDPRFTHGLVLDVLEVLKAHGYVAAGDRSVGAAIVALSRLVRTYEGEGD